MTNTCIRILADANQIKQCKEKVSDIQDSIFSFSRIFNLAGNEVRLKILFLLNEEGEMCPCDLSDVLDMTVPAISQHLRKLKDGGIVNSKKVGQTIFYSVVEENAQVLVRVLESLSQEKETVS